MTSKYILLPIHLLGPSGYEGTVLTTKVRMMARKLRDPLMMSFEILTNRYNQ